jgi:hypothetical protein
MHNNPMAHPTKAHSKLMAQQQRRARLEAELRSNLRKRKDQARGRAERDPSGLPQAEGEPEQQPDAREAATRPTGEVA